MIKKTFIFSLVSIFILTSCSKDVDNLNIDAGKDNKLVAANTIGQDFNVVDGCLHFDNMEVYNNLSESLNGKNEEELLAWSKTNGYTSLLDSYKKMNASLINENIEYNEDEELLEMSNRIDATLFNDEGILYVGDTIYKVIDDYVYIINDANPDKIAEIVNSSDRSQYPRFKHTEYLFSSSATKAEVSKGERSLIIDVSSKRREFVRFYVSTSTNVNGILFVNIRMVGQAQKKGLWWGRPFDDEMNWGQIVCDGILLNDQPFGSRIVGTKTFGETEAWINPIPLTASNVVRNLRVHVTFNFCKAPVAGDESYPYEYFLR